MSRAGGVPWLHLHFLLRRRLHAEVLGHGGVGVLLGVLGGEADPGEAEEGGGAEEGGEGGAGERERAGVGVTENVTEIRETDIGQHDNLVLEQGVINDPDMLQSSTINIEHHLENLKRVQCDQIVEIVDWDNDLVKRELCPV